MCPVYEDVCVSMSGVMMNPRSDGSDLRGAELVSCLILFDLIREWAITMALKGMSLIFQSKVFQVVY